uniref:Titin n=1 Tax=Periophthalmus magnuspinnatus TaxID=409849 RepID=A0A3B3Z9Z3_9GOBI
MRICIPFKGRPAPEISWSKEDGELPSKVQIETGEDYSQLSVDICDRYDAGKYILKLENSAGTKTAFVSVKVLDTPGAPINLTVKDIKRQSVTLTWEPKMVNIRATATLRLFVTIKGKPEPEVKWSKADGTLNERTQIEVTSSYTMLVIENVDRFDTGKYVLTLENLSGSKSAFINVRVLDSPSAPTNLEVKDVKRSSVSLSWEPPLIDGGAKISHYIVEKREQKRMAFTSVSTNCVRNSFIISDLQEGGRYYFRVLAVNELGVGLPASTEQVKVSEAPLPPGKIVVVDVTRHTVTLSWEKPDHDGGSKITNYIVEMQPKGDDKWTVCSESKALEATIDGLTTGEEYSFRVTAVNDKGYSDPKPLANPVVVKDITLEPTFNMLFSTYSVKAGDDLKIDVPFRGRPQPEVSWKKDGHTLKQTTRVNVVNSKTSSKILIKDATKDDVGKYEITLSNSVGTKKAEISVIILDKPGPPSNIKVDEVSADFVCLSWDSPAYDGGCQINNYVVEKRDTTTTTWQIVSATVARTSIKVTRLNQGTEYHFRVAAENRYGKSHSIDSVPVVAQYPFEPPGPPTNLHVATANKYGMLVVWGKPASDGGSPVTGYHIECKDQSSILWTKVIRGVNKYGDGEPLESDAVKAIDPFTVAAAPTNVQVTAVTSEAMTICWDRPASDGGSSISGYVIEKREKTGLRWCRVNKKPVYDLRVKASNLRDGCEYEYRVFAENSAGLSAPSIPCPLTKAEDPQFLPSPPAKPKIIDSSKTTVTLSWNKPLFDGGAPVTGYRVEYRKSADDEWFVGVQNTKNTEFTVVGLTPGVEYVFVVKSINKIGASEPSPESERQVAKEREEEPVFEISNEMRKTLIVKDGSSFTLTVPFKGKPVPNVTWSKPDVDLRVRAVIDTTDTFTSITLEKATRNDSGKYTVTLSNVAGTASLTLSVRVLDSPGPPARVEVKDVTKTSATVTWDTPENEGGGPVKNYLVDIREASKKGWTRLTDTCHRLTYKVTDLSEGGVFYFRVIGENEYGIGVPAETKEGTKISGAPEIEIPQEYFQEVKYKAESNVELKFNIIAKPAPTIEWMKDGRELKPSAQVSFKHTSESTSLFLRETTRLNSGTYEVKVKNSLGSTCAVVRLLIQGTKSFI